MKKVVKFCLLSMFAFSLVCFGFSSCKNKNQNNIAGSRYGANIQIEGHNVFLTLAFGTDSSFSLKAKAENSEKEHATGNYTVQGNTVTCTPTSADEVANYFGVKVGSPVNLTLGNGGSTLSWNEYTLNKM